MLKNSTFSELLSYAYNENGLCDSDRIQRAIDGDPLLQTEFNLLTETLKMLNDAMPEVRPETIDKILKFA